MKMVNEINQNFDKDSLENDQAKLRKLMKLSHRALDKLNIFNLQKYEKDNFLEKDK
ncbi:unnamed protein product [Paramecium sonneborni]|uniref:Uncharacterized protein n=1 Tax=Paramecium sonneborni TaxID=65129 RepID=A0A8S1L6V1_9CILI|nr:unnamed protein product [Paramecium sonneborni]